MSKNLSSVAVSSFDTSVKHAYQAEGQLRRLVRVKTGVIGSSHRFTKIGKGAATPRLPQTDVVPMNIGYSTETANISDWNAPEYTDLFDAQKVNFNERDQLAFIIGSAMSRREDQLIFDALAAASTTLTVGTNIGGTSSNLNTVKMRDANKQLGAGNVPKRDRHFLAHENNIYGLLGDTEATNADYNMIRTLVNGEVNSWLGFKIHSFGDYDEGGLPLSTSIRTCYAFHGGNMGAVGHAVGIDMRTEVNYVPEKTSWLANGMFAMGSTHIDAGGIVELSCTEA